MAEEKVEPRETTWRQLLPWTELFRGFQVALDLNKLALAAAGILATAFAWWLLAVLFTAGENADPPTWSDAYATKANGDKQKAWQQFKQERDHWNLLHATAGLGRDPFLRVAPTDLIDSYDEYVAYDNARTADKASFTQLVQAARTLDDAQSALDKAKKEAAKPETDAGVQKAQDAVDAAQKNLTAAEDAMRQGRLDTFLKTFKDSHIPESKAITLASMAMGEPGPIKPYARLATWPWFEDRGPNQFLMATGQLGKPWETGHFWDWLFTQQVPVLIEPIVKLLMPIVYFFSPGADVKCKLYFLCVLLATVLIWSVFGGAITRIAVVQVARGEKIGMIEALNFTRKRLFAYLTAPLFPLLVILLLLIVMIVFGYPFMIPIFGDVIMAGLFWPVMIILGLLMAITLVGLVGWPLMAATVSAEGTDSWEAVSRAYSYVYQKPWHFIWYTLVAVAYGAVIVFFVGFMGSLTVYLAKWGVSQTPGLAYVGRQPDFLFVYAPTSYGWRDLLLKDSVVGGEKIVGSDGTINWNVYNKWVGSDPNYNGSDKLQWWNLLGAFLVGVWLWIGFLLLLGFSYSYFWSAGSIIYLLLRRSVDGAEMDEVTLEDEEGEGAFGGGPLTTPAAPPPAVKPGTTSLTMVDAPSLRPATPSAATPTPATAPSPPLSSPTSPEAAASPVAPAPKAAAEDGGATPRTEVGAGPTEPRP